MNTKTVSQEQLTAYAIKHSWRNQMDQSSGLDGWSNYGGNDLGHVVVVLGRNRDSDTLTESNFESALESLGGESETVKVHRFGHWACGWYELLVVDPSNDLALRTAFDIYTSLQDYPVLDDADFSERESEAYAEYAEQAQDDLADALALHFGLEDVDGVQTALKEVAYQLNMSCQHLNGEDSCVNVYDMREPDDHDLSRLGDALEDSRHQFGEDSLELALIDYLLACLGESKGA